MVVPYRYGLIAWMKKTLNIDPKLLAETKEACGAAAARRQSGWDRRRWCAMPLTSGRVR